MASELLLDVRGLKTYLFTLSGIVRAVDGVGLQIRRRERVALVGESGCGKTMTVLSIIRLVPNPPAKIIGGSVLFRNRNLLEASEDEMVEVRGKEISTVFQDPMTFLNPVMKVGDQVKEAIILHHRVSKKEATEKAIEALRLVRIPDPEKVYGYYPHQLSGGMRQRILISIALSCRPFLLLADEPTTALDVTIQSQILGLISEVTKELDSSLLLITHDLGIVASMADTVHVMYVGKIVEHADVFSIYEEPKHPYTQGLLQSTLSIDEFKKDLVTIGGMVPDALNPPLGCRFHPRCPNAMDICRREEPPEIGVSKGHFVSCWLYSKG